MGVCVPGILADVLRSRGHGVYGMNLPGSEWGLIACISNSSQEMLLLPGDHTLRTTALLR